jgi:hypothetical protein
MALHQNVRRAVAPAALEPVGETSVWQGLESICGKWRPGGIATEPFQPASVSGGHGHVGVQAHPTLANAAGGCLGV